MKTQHLISGSAALALLSLIACNTNENRLTTSTDDPDEGRYHEKSFSWTEATGPLAKGSTVAAISSKETTFATADELVVAVKALEESLSDKEFTSNLWKPVDYACDELDLAVWNEYGTIRVGDTVVFDEATVRERCHTMVTDIDPQLNTLGKSANSHPGRQVVEGQHPYKMIGSSWSNFNLGIYKSTGGETQFKKRRKIFGFTGWYDLQAERIGTRIYLFDCGNNVDKKRACWIRRSTSEWNRNDDHVAIREPAFGFSTNGTLNGFLPKQGWVPMWTPSQFHSKLEQLNSAFRSASLGYFDLGSFLGDFYSYSKIWSIPIPDFGLMNLHVADGVISMHSVNHGTMKFRAISSDGLGDINSAENHMQLDFVTW